MKTLRDYQQFIHDEVKKISQKDRIWDFTVKSYGKNLVRIRWSYLTYCEEKVDYFMLRLDSGDGDMEDFITSRTPQDKMISGHVVVEENPTFNQETFENGIRHAIQSIFEYAHRVY